MTVTDQRSRFADSGHEVLLIFGASDDMAARWFDAHYRLLILLSRPNDASEMAKRWFKPQCKGGTGKAEDAKLQDAGINLKSAQKNERQKKAGLLYRENRWVTGRAM